MRREMYAETSAKHFVTDQRTIDAALNLASALLSSDETEEAQKFCRETLRKLKRGCPPNDARVVTCVETSASGARQFFTKSFLGDGVAALAPSSGGEPASPRHRAGVASMAWRTDDATIQNAP